MMKEKITKYICAYFGVSIEDAKSSSRQQRIYYARGFCMLFLQKYCALTTIQIGAYFNRNHSTVSQALIKFNNEIPIYKQMQQQYSEIDTYIGKHKDLWKQQTIPKSETFELLLEKLDISIREKTLWRLQFYKETPIKDLI